jgi:hypothetical protein
MPPAPVTPPQTSGVTADIVPTDLYPDNQPVGVMWVRITNNGPSALTNKKVSITLSQSRSTFGNPPVVDSYTGPATEYILNLAPGQTQTINLGAQIDTSHYRYDFTVTVAAVDFTDPNSANNTYKESVGPVGATLNLTNQSGAGIDSVHFTVSGDPWGEDRLMPGEFVANGQTRTWLITAGTYDLRAYIGDQVLDERLNVGISGTYDWTVWASLDIHNSTSFTIGEVYIVPAGWPDWGANLLNPGETIPQYAVRRFNLAPGSYDLHVRDPVNNYNLGLHLNAAVAGACAWFVPDNIFTCAP